MLHNQTTVNYDHSGPVTCPMRRQNAFKTWEQIWCSTTRDAAHNMYA